jgi:hypothetical protein
VEWVIFLTVSLRGGGSASLVETTFSGEMVGGRPKLRALDSLGGK